VRAVAIALVLLSHTIVLIDWPRRFSDMMGHWGVEVFFVLSGFLIGRILIENLRDDKSIFSFWWRRWMRTLPSYVLFLMLNTIIALAIQWGIDKWKFLTFLFFLQNFYKPDSMTFFVESWSLAVEEWFYLLTPLVMYSFKQRIRSNHLNLAWLLIGMILFSIILRYLHFNNSLIMDFEAWEWQVRKVVMVRMDSLLMGILGAYFYVYHEREFFRYRLTFAAAGLGLTGLFMYQYMKASGDGLYFSVPYLLLVSFAILLLFPLVTTIDLRGYLRRGIEWVSKTSYILYLSHSPIMILLLYYLSDSPLNRYWLISIWLVATLVVSYIVHRFFEQPIMDRR